MSNITARQQLDANDRVINANEAILLEAPWTFDVTTTGLQAAHTLFTVTGQVVMTVFAVVKTTLDSDGAPTIEVGVVGNTAVLIAQSLGKSLAAGEVWVDGTLTRVGVGAIPAMQVVNALDVILTVGTTTVKAGKLIFYCLWRPLSTDGNVEITTPA